MEGLVYQLHEHFLLSYSNHLDFSQVLALSDELVESELLLLGTLETCIISTGTFIGRYASLSFKTACDAKLAVKEMNGREIKGKAMKVQLKRTIKEKGIQDNQNCMKQKWENQRPLSKHRNKYQKNSDLILEVPAVISATFILPPDDPFSLKMSDVSKDDLKSPLPALPLANVFRPASGSSEVLLCVSGSSKVFNSDSLFSKSLPKESSFEVDQEDIADSLLPFSSVQYTPNPSSTFIPPNTLNLRSFRKVVKKLEELYPEITRDNILDALVEIKENKGQLSGLPLSTIVQMTSSLLNKKFVSKSEKSNLRNKQTLVDFLIHRYSLQSFYFICNEATFAELKQSLEEY
ncbi:RNA-binding protein 44 [Protobothrops mucrosquamatus]|uniref:RNA-binding protein 44 n=1 Tax=Protobothrops mucrosquamatus TaxID=103944 RepID=UPI0010FAE203|nr:RNA-binding protein 44 [Protobothrops mucrosquamatus]